MLVLCLSLVAASCDRGTDRPDPAVWQESWETERDGFPDADRFLAGGTELCDTLVGQLRVSLPDLRPAPTEALDDAVRAWTDHAETIAFECPHDPARLADALELLDILEAEIDAGLRAQR